VTSIEKLMVLIEEVSSQRFWASAACSFANIARLGLPRSLRTLARFATSTPARLANRRTPIS
jgi:hypothetical protein